MKNRKGVPYCVAFDTTEMPGKVVAIRVELSKYIMDDLSSARVDLAAHPLYHYLWAYCRDNLPQGHKR